MRSVPAGDLLTDLRGKDVLLVFVESYGRVAVEGSSFAPGVNEVLDSGTRQLERAGFASRSAYLTSPTFGAVSWLAHSTLQSGLWVDSQQRYDQLVTSPRLTLSSLFGRAGWRTVADIPANTRDWPQGAFYDFDHVYDSRNVGYQGPRFGYPTMPDQYTLDAFHRLELAPTSRGPGDGGDRPDHQPCPVVPDAADDSPVRRSATVRRTTGCLRSCLRRPTSGRPRSGSGRRTATRSSTRCKALMSFLTTYGDKDLVVVMLGDHQPATIVSGEDAGHDVPITMIARDPAVLDRISGWDWTEGLRPGSDAPVWRMDTFRDRFLAAYSSSGHTGDLPASTR